MTDDLTVRVEHACQQLLTAGTEVTFAVDDHVIRLWRTLRDRQRGVSSLV